MLPVPYVLILFKNSVQYKKIYWLTCHNFLQVDKMAPEGAREKNIIIKGPPEAVEAAKRLISEKIGGRNTSCLYNSCRSSTVSVSDAYFPLVQSCWHPVIKNFIRICSEKFRYGLYSKISCLIEIVSC
jgi:hypothetical protein